MTPVAQLVYDAVVQYWRAFCVPPTVSWLSGTLGRSKSVVWYHLRQLERAGLLVRSGRKWVPVEIFEYVRLFTPRKESLCRKF